MITQITNLRRPEKTAGIFAFLTGIAVIATLLTSIEFFSSYSLLKEDIEYLNENMYLLKINSVVWLVSALFISLSAAALIVVFQPHSPVLATLLSFFLILAAVMFSITGLKGFSIINLMDIYLEKDVQNAELVRISVFSLSREKEIFVTASYALIGVSFFMIGLFAMMTRKISIATGVLSIITGLLLAVFSSISLQSILTSVGISLACILFFILSYRLLFSGLIYRGKKKVEETEERPEEIY